MSEYLPGTVLCVRCKGSGRIKRNRKHKRCALCAGCGASSTAYFGVVYGKQDGIVGVVEMGFKKAQTLDDAAVLTVCAFRLGLGAIPGLGHSLQSAVAACQAGTAAPVYLLWFAPEPVDLDAVARATKEASAACWGKRFVPTLDLLNLLNASLCIWIAAESSASIPTLLSAGPDPQITARFVARLQARLI